MKMKRQWIRTALWGPSDQKNPADSKRTITHRPYWQVLESWQSTYRVTWSRSTPIITLCHLVLKSTERPGKVAVCRLPSAPIRKYSRDCRSPLSLSPACL
ncbi:hypothetical protein EYF80_022842 [Liparis tanakae]|uniref:Uncharacterized protein n=1 Tax=Liparis tanakae TaxID=230148 RepID=A0A4Z2HNT7_9TELE|nr:hypothetical protein EYF80_022842 [Liparis tanakae]